MIQLDGGSSPQHVIFGHALQESFVLGRLDVSSLTVQVTEESRTGRKKLIEHLDSALADLICAGRFAADASPFSSSSLREIASHGI